MTQREYYAYILNLTCEKHLNVWLASKRNSVKTLRPRWIMCEMSFDTFHLVCIKQNASVVNNEYCSMKVQLSMQSKQNLV